MADQSATHAGSDGRGPEYPEGDGLPPARYATYTRASWDEQDEALRPLHRTWQRNLLFLVGQQTWEPDARGVFRPRVVDPWIDLPTVNFCLPFYKTFLAKATRTRPTWQVIPASTQPSDIQSAELGEEVLVAKWTELKMARRHRRAVAWTIITGNCGRVPYWSTDTGKIRKLEVPVDCPVLDDAGQPTGETEVLTVPCDEDGRPQLDAMGRPKPGAKPHAIDRGEIDDRILSPWQWRVNPEATCDEDVVWYITGEPLTIREIERRWPEVKGQVGSEDLSEIEWASATLTRIAALDGEVHASPRDQRDRHLPKALVMRRYEKPSVKYPDGRYWAVAGGVMLEEPQGLPDGLWPGLIHMQDVVVPGRYHAMSTMEAVVGLNREYNDRCAKIKEYEHYFVGGKWLVPRPSGITRSQITTEPAEVLKYNWPYEPKQLRIEPLPQSFYMERDRVAADFERVSGIRQVSQGGSPTGVTAGIAIASLQEADDTDLGPFLQVGEEAIAELAGYFLQLIKQNYDDERIYYAAGPSRGYMVKAFRGSDLEGAVDVVPQGSGTMLGMAARQQLLLQVATEVPEMFKDPETGEFDRNRLARLLPVGGMESLYESEDVDVQEAMREEETISAFGGESREVPQVSPWQNHEVHHRQHRRTLAAGEWRQWPEAAQRLLLAHFAETMAALTQARGQRAMMAAAASGKLPPAPEGRPLPEEPQEELPPDAEMGMGEEDAPPEAEGLDTLMLDEPEMAMA